MEAMKHQFRGKASKIMFNYVKEEQLVREGIATLLKDMSYENIKTIFSVEVFNPFSKKGEADICSPMIGDKHRQLLLRLREQQEVQFEISIITTKPEKSCKSESEENQK